MFIRAFTISIITICLTTTVRAQLNNQHFEQRMNIQELDSGIIKFGFNTLAFTKNNEYFNDIADGFTLFGYQVNPYVSYQPLKNVRIDIGAYLQKDFGNNDFTEIAPTYAIKYNNHGLQLIFGTLEGSVSHRLVEPLYDFEKVLIDRLENGMQVIVDNERLFLDGWVNWQNMIYKGDNDQEEVTGGLSLEYRLTDSKQFNLFLPVQLVVFHSGGQIDSSPLPLQTYTNSAIGISGEWTSGNDSFFRTVRSDNYYISYKDFSTDQLQAFEDGSGIYLNLSAKTKINLEAMVSYWRGNEYITITGGQLYPSVSSSFKKSTTVEEERELLIFRFMHDIKLTNNLFISSRFEPFYDLKNAKFEFSHAFYINYRQEFDLNRKK